MMTLLIGFLVFCVLAFNIIPVWYSYGHCVRSEHSRDSWIKFLSEAKEYRKEFAELPFYYKYPHHYMLWLSLLVTKTVTGVDPETVLFNE